MLLKCILSLPWICIIVARQAFFLIESHIDFLKPVFQVASNRKANAFGNRFYKDKENCVGRSVGLLTEYNAAANGKKSPVSMVRGNEALFQTDVKIIDEKHFEPNALYERATAMSPWKENSPLNQPNISGLWRNVGWKLRVVLFFTHIFNYNLEFF